MAGVVHEVENHRLVEQVEQEAACAARELAESAHLSRGQIVVVGCSTSEVVGHQVGSWSTPEVADAIFRGLASVFTPMGVYIAAQCCEHLNRALIVMHLKKVAVPVRLAQKHIGQAILLAARTRPKFIGGERAIYDESLKEGYPDFAG